MVEEKEGVDDEDILTVVVEEARREVEAAILRVQVMQGDPRRVPKGARLEGSLEKKAKGARADTVNVKVEQRAGSVLDIEADDPTWAELSQGTQLKLSPTTNATLYRNLLKAFLVCRKWDHGLTELLHPARLPNLPADTGAPVRDEGLRPAQAEALRKMLRSPLGGLTLIQGPPGTGKTTVIARFISEAAKRGESVLIASHTHVAIDNAMRKAVQGDRKLVSKMVRLGEGRNVSADLLPWNKTMGGYWMDPEDEDAIPLFESITRDTPIVGMTLDALACALVNAERLDQEIRPFDHVVVDEAGMNAFPKIAVARAAGKRMVLVGDPMQLPPIIRAWSYKDDAHYKRSHFEVLQMMRPDLSVMLDEQFRCDPAIYSWSADAVYNSKVESRRGSAADIPKVLGQLVGPVAWVDTSRLREADRRIKTSRINETNLTVAYEIIRGLLEQRIPPEQIGYISPFKAQTQEFKDRAVREKRADIWGRITASTVDAFQGSERRVIVYDLTTRRPAKPHEDHRRLNVSLTRAQDLLIILGPRDFVQNSLDNPYYSSLQRWAAAAVITAPPMAKAEVA